MIALRVTPSVENQLDHMVTDGYYADEESFCNIQEKGMYTVPESNRLFIVVDIWHETDFKTILSYFELHEFQCMLMTKYDFRWIGHTLIKDGNDKNSRD
jgi:hypothetical protein